MSFFGFSGGGLEPGIADGLEAALLTAQPLQAEVLDSFRRGKGGGRGFDFAGDGGKCPVEFGFAVAGQVGDVPHDLLRNCSDMIFLRINDGNGGSPDCELHCRA